MAITSWHLMRQQELPHTVLISLSPTLLTAEPAKRQTQTADNGRCVLVFVCVSYVCQQKAGKGQLSGAHIRNRFKVNRPGNHHFYFSTEAKREDCTVIS